MKYCRKCKLSVNTGNNYCPLCSSGLAPCKPDESSAGKEQDYIEEYMAEDGPASDIYPPPDAGREYNLVLRLFLFLTFAAVSTCVLVNILAWSGVLWSLVVIGAIQFLWAAIAYPIMVRKNVGHMIMVDVISACILLVIIQTTTHTQGWGLDYVIPFLFIAATTTISFIIMVKRMRWREYSVYQFIMIILGLLPVISCVSGMAKVLWPSIGSAFYSFLTFIGMFIFADKKYKNELKKRLHF